MRIFMLFAIVLVAITGQVDENFLDAIETKNCVLVGELHTLKISRIEIEAALPTLKKQGFEICIELEERLTMQQVRDMDLYQWSMEPDSEGSLTHLILAARDIGVKVSFIDKKGSLSKRDVHMTKRISTKLQNGGKVLALVGAYHANRANDTLAVRLDAKRYSPETFFFLPEKSIDYRVEKDDEGTSHLWERDLIFDFKSKSPKPKFKWRKAFTFRGYDHLIAK